jgi:hypothetical protein
VVGLSGVKVEHRGEDHHESNHRPLNNRGPRLEVVDAFNLTITTSTEPSLVLLDSTIRELLAIHGTSSQQSRSS